MRSHFLRALQKVSGTGLNAWWKLDETSGTTAADSSGNGKDATVYASPTWAAGKIRNCLYFSGNSGKYATATSVALTSDITIAFWIKSDGANWYGSGAAGFISTMTSGDSNRGANGFVVQGETGGKKIDCALRNGANDGEVSAPSYTPASIDGWNHYAVTFNDTTNACKVYWNGVEVGSSTPSLARNASESRTVYLGHIYEAWERNLKGWLDDVRIYNRALSASEIYALYAPSPDAWWKLDETSGTTAADSSGNAITGTLVNSPSWVAGQINNALDFNGTNQSVTLASNSVLAMESGSFTFAAWVNPDVLTGNQWYKVIGSPTGGASFGIRVQAGPSIVLRLTKTNTADFAEGPGPIATGVWSHIAVVMNRTDSSLTYYLNGVATSVTYDATTFTAEVQTDTIGANPSGYFDGKIDDVRIYNRALSATEITTLYNDIPKTSFNMLIDTTKAGTSTSTQFTLPCTGSGYDADVDWGDGSAHTTLSGSPGNVTHTYSTSGTYTVKILENTVGGFPRIYFNDGGDRLKLMQISQWGTNKWVSLNKAFSSCSNLTITATDAARAITGLVTDFSSAWQGCSSLTSFPVLDVASGTNFSVAWYGCSGLTSFPSLQVGKGTNFASSWQYCTGLTSFPSLDTSKGTNISYAWNGCTGLTSFPSLDTRAVTAFNNTWEGCTGLNNYAFPALDMHLMTNGSSCFSGVTLSTTSYSNILNQLANGNGGIVANANNSVSFHGGNSKYNTGAATARTTLTTSPRNWTITDGGAE